MATKIFKDYADFCNRSDKKINGVSKEFSELNLNYKKENKDNEGCWNCYECSGCSRCYECYECSDCYRCSRCSDCSGCSGCYGCYDCSGCLDCSGCSGCLDLKNAKSTGQKDGVWFSEIPVIPNIHQAIYDYSSQNGNLDMSDWHADEQINEEGAHCGTTHCRAGTAVFMAGKAGRELEKETSTLFAALQIYKKSSAIRVSPVRFFESNEVALADMKRCAEEEKALSK